MFQLLLDYCVTNKIQTKSLTETENLLALSASQQLVWCWIDGIAEISSRCTIKVTPGKKKEKENCVLKTTRQK